MPGQFPIESFFNVAEIKSEYDTLIEMNQKLADSIKSLSSGEGMTKFIDSIKTMRSEAANAEFAIAGLVDQVTRLAAQQTTLNNTVRTYTARTEDDIRAQLRAREITKQRTDAIKGETDAYKRLSVEAANLTRNAKMLAAQFGVQSSAAKEAAASALLLNNRLKAIDASVGQNGRNVGNYFASIKQFGAQMLAQFSAIAVVFGSINFLKDSAKQFEEAEKRAAALNNILSNIGRQDVFNKLKQGAQALSDQFKIFKASDIVGVFNQLVTYGKLTKNQIEQLTPIIINFSAKTGKSLEESTSIIEKALEGSGRSLKEFGINMKDGGGVTERFSLLMKELKPRVEGAAEAFGNTLAGSIQKSNVEIDNLKIEIGQELAPSIKWVFQSIADGLKGIPQMWTAIKNLATDIVETTVDGLTRVGLAIKGAFSGSFVDLAVYAANKNAADKQAKDKAASIKEWSDIETFAQQYADDAKKKSLKEQEKLLKQQQVLRDASVKAYLDMVKQGKENTPAGHGALMRASGDQQFVAKLTESIADQKDKRILGVGGDVGDKAKKQRDYEKEYKELIEQFKKLDEETKGFNMDAYHKEMNTAVADFHAGMAKIALLRENDLKEFKNDEKAKANIRKLASEAELALRKETDDKLMEIENRHNEDLAKQRNDQGLKETIQAQKDNQTQFDDAVLEAKNIAGANPTKTTLKEKLEVANREGAAAKHKNDTDETNGIISPETQGLKNTAEDQSTQAKKDAIAEADTKKQQEKYAKYFDYAKQATELIDGIEKSAHERKMNRIQHEMDMVQKQYEEQTKSIEHSSLSVEQKAAKQILLDASVHAKTEALQRKERLEKIKDAEFDKKATIIKMTLATTEAVLGDLLKAGGYTASGNYAQAAIAYAEAIIAGATGSAQIAVAAATPVPKYAVGVVNKPTSGPAIVGEEGSEMIIDPSGKMSMSPSTATLTHLQKGTSVIPHELTKIMNEAMAKSLLVRMPQNNDKKLDELAQAIRQGDKAVIKAIKGIKGTNVHISNETGWTTYINKAVYDRK